MGKVIGYVYNYIQSTWPYSSPNTTFIKAYGLLGLQLQATIGKKGASVYNTTHTKYLSIINYKNALDSAKNIVSYSPSVSTPAQHNHRDTTLSKTPDNYSRPIKDVINFMDGIILQNNITNSHNTNMFDTTVTCDDESQYFSTPRENNHSATSQSYYFQLRSDFLQFQYNITHKMTSQNNLFL